MLRRWREAMRADFFILILRNVAATVGDDVCHDILMQCASSPILPANVGVTPVLYARPPPPPPITDARLIDARRRHFAELRRLAEARLPGVPEALPGVSSVA